MKKDLVVCGFVMLNQSRLLVAEIPDGVSSAHEATYRSLIAGGMLSFAELDVEPFSTLIRGRLKVCSSVRTKICGGVRRISAKKSALYGAFF